MRKKVVVLGGGVGGLAAGWMLGRSGLFEVTVVEKAAVVGGRCGTFQHEDMLLDYGPHKFYSTLPGIVEEVKDLMGDEFFCHQKQNHIYLFGKYLSYPLKFSELALQMGFANLLRCGGSFFSVLGNKLRSQKENPSYTDYVVRNFGPAIYNLVFEPLAEKTWGSPETLSADIARARIPSKGMADLLARLLGLTKENHFTNAPYFYYPKRGFGRIPARMAEEIKKEGGRVLTRCDPRKILVKDHRIRQVEVVHAGKSEILPLDYLISTLPFDLVLGLMEGGDETEKFSLLELAKRLQYRDVFLVYLILKRERVTKDHWIFFPERKWFFGRLFEQKNMSETMVPPEKTVLCCDFTVEPGGSAWAMSDEQLANRCLDDLQTIGMIQKEKVTGFLVRRFVKFYPRYDLFYKETTHALYSSLKEYENFLSTGRIGFYNYNNSDHCVDMGKSIAENLSKETPINMIWDGLEKRVQHYQIVD